MLIANRNGMAVGGKLMAQITLTQNCTNCLDLGNHIADLCVSAGITTGMCSIVASETRNNMVGVVPVIYGLCIGIVLRYRNGSWTRADIATSYDADARIGDVYNVYEPAGLWNSANLNGGGRKCVVILIICAVCYARSRSCSPSRFSRPRQPSSEWRAAA